jgi:hypothetical protein
MEKQTEVCNEQALTIARSIVAEISEVARSAVLALAEELLRIRKSNLSAFQKASLALRASPADMQVLYQSFSRRLHFEWSCVGPVQTSIVSHRYNAF